MPGPSLRPPLAGAMAPHNSRSAWPLKIKFMIIPNKSVVYVIVINAMQ